jgi:NAD-dependent dihydropyrimidine dehydrogenase PreA subunit
MREGAGNCEDVCPFHVFELRKLTKSELKALPFGPWLKVKVHGGKQAFVVNGDDCHACGLCVAACPEKAIRLTRIATEEN